MNRVRLFVFLIAYTRTCANSSPKGENLREEEEKQSYAHLLGGFVRVSMHFLQNVENKSSVQYMPEICVHSYVRAFVRSCVRTFVRSYVRMSCNSG